MSFYLGSLKLWSRLLLQFVFVSTKPVFSPFPERGSHLIHCFSLLFPGVRMVSVLYRTHQSQQRNWEIWPCRESCKMIYFLFFSPFWISKRIFFLVLLMLRSSWGPSLLTSLLYIFEDSWQKEGVLSLDALVSSVSAHRQYPGGAVLIDTPTSFHASFSLYAWKWGEKDEFIHCRPSSFCFSRVSVLPWYWVLPF